MKSCTIKFVISEKLLNVIENRLGIDFSGGDSANKTLEVLIKNYLTDQVKISEGEMEVKVIDI